MKQKMILFSCILSVLFLCVGCGKLLPGNTGDLHGEFLIVVSNDSTSCVLKPLGDEIPEELKDSEGNVLPRNAILPEGHTFREGDSIEADYCIPVPKDSALEDAMETLVSGGMEPLIKEEAPEWGEPLQITEASLLSAATPESLQEVRDFQYEYGLTEEARQQYEEDRINRLLNETPIRISYDVDWMEVIFYDSDEQRNYKFTEPSDVAMIQGFLCNDTWTLLPDVWNGGVGSSISIYTEQEGVRYIIIPYSDENDNLCFDVSVLEEEGTRSRCYLADGIRYETFINNLNLFLD